MEVKYGNLTKIQDQNLCRWKWASRGDLRDIQDQKKNRNNVREKKTNIKNSVLDYMRYKHLN